MSSLQQREERWDCLFTGYSRSKLYIPLDIMTLFILYHGENNSLIFLTRDITGGHIKSHNIAQYLLQFNKSKWNFNNDRVNMYRITANARNHRSNICGR